jgi:hypothetical protein
MSNWVSTYEPREQFMPFHMRKERFAAMVCHRRAGKTVACINDAVTKAIYNQRKRPVYAYVGPILKQAKKVAWGYLKEYTDGLTDKVNESELYVRLKHNQATIWIYGADNPDSVRGLYHDGIILDEFGDMHPKIWSANVLPTLSDRQGWAVFIGTPKGKNHFYKVFERSKTEPEWYNFILRASQSGIINDAELALMRREMDTEDEYLQEYECSFDAAVLGTYYTKILSRLEATGKIYNADADHDPDQEVYVAFDIGRSDSTAAWFWQVRPDGVAVIDHLEANGQDPEFYFDLLEKKQYKYAAVWLPHDARAKTFATKRSTVEQFLDAGFPVRIGPKLDIQDGINAARKVLPQCYFHRRTEEGVECLREYRREYDAEKKVYCERPLHNWASHTADAFRYMALVLEDSVAKPQEDKRIITLDLSPKYNLNQLFAERDSVLRLGSRRRI